MPTLEVQAGRAESIGDHYFLMRSRFQPVTKGHLEAVTYFFDNLPSAFANDSHHGDPKLVFAIVCDLMRGTQLEKAMKKAANFNRNIEQYLIRFRPEYNPLTPLEIVEDLLALIHDFRAEWRARIGITLMPEFACTMHALNARNLPKNADYLLKSFIPAKDKRCWLIPEFDQDDVTDLNVATELNECCHSLKQRVNGQGELSRYQFEKDGSKDLGIYAYASSCLLNNERQKLYDIMPESVRTRWERLNLFTTAFERLNAMPYTRRPAKAQRALGSKQMKSAASENTKVINETTKQIAKTFREEFFE